MTTNTLAYFVIIVAIIAAIVSGGYLLIGVFSERNSDETHGSRRDSIVASPPISLRLPAGQAGVVEHDSGARIEVPRGATEEQVTVTIEEVKPPPSPLEVRRAFDFSVGGAELVGPVTVHIPFELEPGQDASSVRALHWDEEGGAWEPVPGLVDESAGTIAVATDRLRLFSSLWVEVEASCAASPGEVEAGETLRVVSTGTSFTLGTIGIYMAPSVTRAGGGVVVTDGSSARTEVTTVGWDDSFELTYETALTEPGEYRVLCRIFWVSAGTAEDLVSPSATVTVRRNGRPTIGADLRIERIYEQLRPIYLGEENNILVEVRNAGDERSRRFNLVADFFSAADGRATRLYGVGSADGMDPGATATRSIHVRVPDDLAPGEYRVCARIGHPGLSGAPIDGGACLDRYVLRRFEGAMNVMVSAIETDGGRAWVALPTDWGDEDLLRIAVDFMDVKDVDTLRALYKRVAVELAFRRAVAPGPERRHVLLQGMTEDVKVSADAFTYITELCLHSGGDCATALERFDLPGSGLLTNDTVGFGAQSVSGALLFGDAYFTMLVNKALDLDQALNTLDQLEYLPLGPIWMEAVGEARRDVAAIASPDGWTAYAAAIVDKKDDVLQFALGQTVSGLTHAAAKKHLLYHLGIAGQKALAHAWGLKIAGGATVGTAGAVATGPARFVASEWFASELDISVVEKKEQLGTAALAAFINAAFSDPALRGDLREAMAYAKYATYDGLLESKDSWLQWISSALELNVQGRSNYLEYMAGEREEALEELIYLLSPESVEVDPGTLALAPGEIERLRARATARSARVAGHSGFEWSSNAPEIATVSRDGVVTGVAPGEAVIAVRAGGAGAWAKVEVAVPTDAGPLQSRPSWSPAAGSSTAATEQLMAGFTENFFGTLDTDRWLLYGSADHLQSEGTIQLTAARRNQLGFLLLRQPISLRGFRIEFSFEIGGGSGADGLGLLLLQSMPDFSQINPSYHAGGGWGSRYFEGFVVAFDTHSNRAGRWSSGGRDFYSPVADPSGNFVALVELGAGGDVFDMTHLATKNLSVDLRDSGPFEAEVVFGADGNVKVYLSNYESGMSRTLVVDHTIENFDPLYAYIGFIGATGAATDRHIIRSVKYNPPRPDSNPR